MIPVQFFALEKDLVELFEYLLDRQGMVALERYSEIGRTARSFSTAAELAQAYPLGVDERGSTFAVSVAVWSSRVRPRPTPERIQLRPEAGGGWRERVDGAGLFTFHLGGRGTQGISYSTFQRDSPSSGSDGLDGAGVRVNWTVHDRLAKEIRAHLRGDWCAGHFGEHPVGRAAHEAVRVGELPLFLYRPYGADAIEPGPLQRTRRRSVERTSPSGRLPYLESFVALDHLAGLMGKPRPHATKRPAHDDDVLGPSLFKTFVGEIEAPLLTLPRLYIARTELSECSFAGSDFRLSTWNWNDFLECDFSGCDLRDGDLRGNYWWRCSFRAADLRGADLRTGRFVECDFTGAETAGAALSLRSWARVIARRPDVPRLTLRQLSRMEWSEADPEPPGG